MIPARDVLGWLVASTGPSGSRSSRSPGSTSWGSFEDRKVELIGGMIHEMTINTPQATATRLGNEVFRRIFGAGWVVSDALPLDVGGGSLPQPDFTVVAGSARDFRNVHPTTAALVVENGDSTLKRDRTTKAHLYAKAGVPAYWIVNLVDRQVEVHRQPGSDPARRRRFRYGEVTTVLESGRMSPLAAPGRRSRRPTCSPDVWTTPDAPSLIEHKRWHNRAPILA